MYIGPDKSCMQPAAPPHHRPPPAPRPIPGLHPDSEPFAAALAARKHAHELAAAQITARNALIQSRRRSLSDARDILHTILDQTSRQIASIDAAHFVLFSCADEAVDQVEARFRLGESERYFQFSHDWCLEMWFESVRCSVERSCNCDCCLQPSC